MNPGSDDRRDEFFEGSQIDGYRIVRRVGEGGFGAIYLAEQTEPVLRQVVLKVLKAGMDSPEMVARFETERQTLAMMKHSSIAVVYGAGRSPGGRYFIVMEWFEGRSITGYCATTSLELRGRLELFVEVCRAVHHAHQRGIIHRDIKPENILVADQDGRPSPKIIDFGIAKLTDLPTPHLTVADQPMGTLEYMSPEQIAAGAAEVDTRSDVYSLGAVLYELLTGTPLHRRGDIGAGGSRRSDKLEKPSTRVISQGTGRPSGAGDHRTHVTTPSRRLIGDLDLIVMKALEDEPDRRYESAAALASDIEHHLRNEPVSASPPTRFYLTKKFLRRHRRGVAAAALSFVSLIGGLWFSLAMAAKAREARAIEARYEAIHSAERDQREAGQREAERIARAMIDTLESELWTGGSYGLMEGVINRAIRYFEKQPAGPADAARRLDESIVWTSSARLNLSRGNSRQASEDLRRVLEIRESLVADHPGETDYAIALAGAYCQGGELAMSRGDSATARDQFSQALGVYDRAHVQPLEPLERLEPWQLGRATVLCGQAELLRRDGELDDARSKLGDALKELGSLGPGSPAALELRASASLVQAMIELDQLDPEAAAQTSAAAVLELEPWVASHPHRATARALVARLQSAMATARLLSVSQAEDIEDSRSALDSALGHLEILLDGDPENVPWRYERFQVMRKLGRCDANSGFFSRARQTYGRALTEILRLRDSSEDLRSWRFDVAMTHYDLAGAELKQRLLDRAAASAGQALAELDNDPPDRGDASSLQWRRAQALVHERHGEISRSKPEGLGDSREHYEAARGIYEELAEADAEADQRPVIARLWLVIAEVDHQSGDHDGAHEAARRARGIYQELDNELEEESPRRAQYLCGVAGSHRQLASGLDPQSDSENAQAIELLKLSWKITQDLGGERSQYPAIKELNSAIWLDLKRRGLVMDRTLGDSARPANGKGADTDYLRIDRKVKTAEAAYNRRSLEEAKALLDLVGSELDGLIKADPTPTPPEWLKLRARIFGAFGLTLEGLGESTAAAEQHEQGIALRRRALVDPESRQELAEYLNYLATTYKSLGQSGSAELALEEAISVTDGLLKDARPQRPPGVIHVLATSHSALGELMRKRGPRNFEAAEEHAVQALVLREEIRSGRTIKGLWNSVLADSHIGIGLILGDKDADPSRYPEARQHYERAIEYQSWLAENSKMKRRYQSALARSYNYLGMLCNRMNRLAEASEALNRALTIQEKLPQSSEIRWVSSATYNNIGIASLDAGDHREAEAAFLKALEIRQELWEALPDNRKRTEGLAEVEDNLGNCYLRVGNYKAAEPPFRAALDHWMRVEKRLESAKVRYLLGKVYYLQSDWETARTYSGDAKVGVEQIIRDSGGGSPDERKILGRVCLQLGQIAVAQGDLEAAENNLQQAQERHKALVAEGHAFDLDGLDAAKSALSRAREAPESSECQEDENEN